VSDADPVPTTRPQQTAVLLSFVLVSFAANSLVTRYVVGNRLLDAYLLTVVRFVAGAVALLVFALGRGERPGITRANLWPAFWLGVYAVCISFGYQYIGAAAGTFVFYATVLAGLVAYDVVSRRRCRGPEWWVRWSPLRASVCSPPRRPATSRRSACSSSR
jgi:drug/metabolite transporter (DMT)-like permease